jgi:hypothetical protein
MLNSLDKRNTDNNMVEPNEGERTLLSSNKGGMRSPSLDFNPNSPLIPEEILIDQLAAILVEGLLAMKTCERNQEKSSDLLPGINERTS